VIVGKVLGQKKKTCHNLREHGNSDADRVAREGAFRWGKVRDKTIVESPLRALSKTTARCVRKRPRRRRGGELTRRGESMTTLRISEKPDED